MEDEIVTGVDKLVQIIDAAGGRISIKDAMKQLKVSKDLVEEWADSLEEMKTISIEYKLFNTFLVRGIGRKEVVKKAKELTLKEEAFEQKLHVSIKDFEKESEGLKHIGEEFDQLSSELMKKRKVIEEELNHLYEFHKLNKTFQDELDSVNTRSSTYITELEKEINDKKAEYDLVLKTIDQEKQIIDEKSRTLDAFLKKAILLNSEITTSKKKVIELQEAAKNIKPFVQRLEKHAVKKFLRMQEEALGRISDKQRVFLNEIMLKRRFMKIGLKENQMIKEKLDRFFGRQASLENSFAKLREEQKSILAELKEIMKLTKEYKVMAKRRDMTKEFKELIERSAATDKRRAKLGSDLKDFKEVVKGKDRTKSRKQSSRTKTKKRPKARKNQ